MKKRFFFLLLLIFASSAVWCENVFVYIEKGIIDLDDEEQNKFNPELLNVMEDGIMECFFDQGHIVFAANSCKTTFRNEEMLSQVAKRGGADLLFKAVINYSEKNNIVEISGNYLFYNLFSDTVVTEGEYNLPDNFNMSGLRVEDLFFTVGKSFAERVSGTL